MTLTAGLIAGIFGLSGLRGFIFYIFCFLLTSCCFYIKMQGNTARYFKDSYTVYSSGIFGDLLLYLMMWVIFHNIVNVL